MNMNNPLENLRQLTEAVRMAGADIAPTYIEYVQLASLLAKSPKWSHSCLLAALVEAKDGGSQR